MTTDLPDIIAKYNIHSTSNDASKIALGMGMVLMAIDGDIDASEINDSAKYGAMIFEDFNKQEFEECLSKIEHSSFDPAEEFRKAKKFLPGVSKNITSQDKNAIYIFLSAIAMADGKVTLEELKMLEYVHKEFNISDIPEIKTSLDQLIDITKDIEHAAEVGAAVGALNAVYFSALSSLNANGKLSEEETNVATNLFDKAPPHLKPVLVALATDEDMLLECLSMHPRIKKSFFKSSGLMPEDQYFYNQLALIQMETQSPGSLRSLKDQLDL